MIFMGGEGSNGDWGVWVIVAMLLLPCALGLGLRLWDRRGAPAATPDVLAWWRRPLARVGLMIGLSVGCLVTALLGWWPAPLFLFVAATAVAPQDLFRGAANPG